jgi:hypothetical protein
MSFFQDTLLPSLRQGGYVLTEFDDESVSTVIDSLEEGISLGLTLKEIQSNRGEEIGVVIFLPYAGRISRAMHKALTMLNPAHPDCEFNFSQERSQIGLTAFILAEDFYERIQPFLSVGLTLTNLLFRLERENYVPTREELELALRIPRSSA